MSPIQPPKHLSKDARAEYRRIVDELRIAGLFDGSRLGLIEMYAAAFGRWRAADRAMPRDGTPTRAQLEALNQAHRHCREIARDLGLPATAQVRNRPSGPRAPADPEQNADPGAPPVTGYSPVRYGYRADPEQNADPDALPDWIAAELEQAMTLLPS